MDTDVAPARSRRQRRGNQGRMAALERLRQIKGLGGKHKYEVDEVDNVYDEVGEEEYSDAVMRRRCDDWIEDDDGSGYVEDGREIFDDDLDDDSVTSVSRRKGGGTKRSRQPSERRLMPTAGGIRAMLMNMPAKKKKEAAVKLEEDDILSDIMQEIHTGGSGSSAGMAHAAPALSHSVPHAVNISPRAYLQSLSMRAQSRVRNLPAPVGVAVVEPTCPGLPAEDGDDDAAVVEEVASLASLPSLPVEAMVCNDDHLCAAALDSVDIEAVVSQDQASQPPVIEEFMSQDLPVIVKQEKEEPCNNGGIDANNLFGGMKVPECPGGGAVPLEVKVDLSQIPLTTTSAGEKVLRMYWLDAYVDPAKKPGTVYLFGKVLVEAAQTYVSCCVIVTGVDRQVFLLPRERVASGGTGVDGGGAVSMLDVYNEFNTVVAPQYGIMSFKSRTIERGYCFEAAHPVPDVSEYLEVKYSSNLRALPSGLSGRTFSCIFGTNTSPLEALLLRCRIKGPCWLDITTPQPVNNPVSWCKVEATTAAPENVTVCPLKMAPPLLVVLTVHLQTTVRTSDGQNEVVMVACLVHHSFPIDREPPQPPFQQHFCLFTKPSDAVLPFDLRGTLQQFKATRLERVESERALLSLLVARLHKLDPDLLVGHDICGFGLKVLAHRLANNKIAHWSRVGRLRRTALPTGGRARTFFERDLTSGRLVCDIKISAKELIRSRSYDLATLCSTVLKMKVEEEQASLTFSDVRRMYGSTPELLQLVSVSMRDAANILRIMCELSVLPLAVQITGIAGNVLSRTLMGGRSERNEFLLLHAFTERNFIVPDKRWFSKTAQEAPDTEPKDGQKGRRQAAYAGGLVLEPKRGFYDNLVLLMDFNSLYPSIIQEYNICFTTVGNPVALPSPGLPLGVLPAEISKLVESRREVKKLMADPAISADLRMQYNIRQLALKLTANSMYGCLGFTNSRFYAKPIAALITAKGREILMDTKALVEKLNYEVIYGDTDSIMISTQCMDMDRVYKIGHQIKQEVNQRYRRLELEVDGVFRSLLLLKKKKYAATVVERLASGVVVARQEVKGLDIVRRDWSKLSAAAGRYVLEQILMPQAADERINNIHMHLAQLRADLEAGQVPLALLTISKELTKAVHLYADSKSVAHVQVAARLNQLGLHRFKPGDTVDYIICEDGTNHPASQRAYHVDELKTNDSLKVDHRYYLAQQIHPVVSRLCDPIDGTDAVCIAECLGLDPTAYRQRMQPENTQDDNLGHKGTAGEEERFLQCDRFVFRCMNDKCGCENSMDGPYRKTADGCRPALECCVNPDCDVAPTDYAAGIHNQLAMAMRAAIARYYKAWLICEDPACTNRLRRLPVHFQRSYPVCTVCRKGVMYLEYSERALYTQLLFYRHVFEARTADAKLAASMPPPLLTVYTQLAQRVEAVLHHSAYSIVSLGKLFAPITPTPGEREKRATGVPSV